MASISAPVAPMFPRLHTAYELQPDLASSVLEYLAALTGYAEDLGGI